MITFVCLWTGNAGCAVTFVGNATVFFVGAVAVFGAVDAVAAVVVFDAVVGAVDAVVVFAGVVGVIAVGFKDIFSLLTLVARPYDRYIPYSNV